MGRHAFDRPAVKRGRKVNCLSGDPADQLHERHEASDFDTKTQDRLGAVKAQTHQRPASAVCRHRRM